MIRISLLGIIIFIVGCNLSVAQPNKTASDSALWKYLEEIDRPTGLDSSFLSGDELRDGLRIFQDTVLGIVFRYDKEVEIVSNEYCTHSTTKDESKWKTYRSDRLGLEFKYPPELELRTRKRELLYIMGCDSSLSITLGYEYTDSSFETGGKAFADLISIYTTRATFDSIAENEGFERNGSQSHRYNSHRRNMKVNPTKWNIIGVQSGKEAAILDGKSWKGLRGHNNTMIFPPGPQHGACVDFQKSFLVLERKPTCSIVCTFFYGPTDIDSGEGEPAYELSEVTFYKIVATIKML